MSAAKPAPQPEFTDADVIRRWMIDSELFVMEAIRPPKITAQQREGLTALTKMVRARWRAHILKTPIEQRNDGEKYVLNKLGGHPLTAEEQNLNMKMGISIMSGHGTGKNAFAAWAILWFLMCFPYPKIPVTGPAGHQVRDVDWAEIHKWMRHSVLEHQKVGSGFAIDQFLTWQTDRIYWTEEGGTEWWARAITVNNKASTEEQAQTIAGLHEDFMMILIDEASAVPDPVYTPLEGSMTGKVNFAMLIFNPTRARGYALATQQSDRARWCCLHWDGEQSELVQPEQIERLRIKYGRDSNFYRVRVRGLPPKADADTLIPWDWVQDAVNRDVQPLDDDPVICGVDVGATSIILTMKGPRVFPLREYIGVDTEQLTNWGLGVFNDLEPDAVFVDSIGLGAGVADKWQHRTRFNIIDVMVQEVVASDDRYDRLRDELWFRTRERFEKRNISIPEDDELIAELTTPKWEFTANGKMKVMSKVKMRGVLMGTKRGAASGESTETVREGDAAGEAWSPNKADALCLCMYYTSEMLRALKRRSMGGEHSRENQRENDWRVL